MPDHYEVLGIDREADDAAVRQAYRRLARTYHPDVNDSPEARAQFEAVQSAYETLSEPLRRQAYDALIARDREQRQAEEIRERMRRIRDEREAKEAEELRRRAEARRMDHVRPTFDEHEYRALRADVDEMQKLANRGELAAASLLAKRILELDPRQADAYAVQADFALAQGDVRAAATAYAFAAQFAPDNAVYLRQYEALTVAAARA
ncbi:MAG: DnaJ domain-containing protein, partial [Fimbriimonadaceae bacterium]